MSQPGLLHHFDGKPALLQAVLENRDARAQARLVGLEGKDIFRALVDISTQNQHERGLVQLYTILAAEATNRDHPAHEYFERRSRMIVSAMTAALEQAQVSGELRPGVSPMRAALEAVAFTEGIQLLWLQGFVEIDLGAQARDFFDAFFVEPL